MLLLKNKKANLEYSIEKTYTAGVVLSGPEVKSLRNKSGSLNGSFIKNIGNELFLINAQISPYKFADNKEYDPKRTRKLLMKKKEIVAKIESTGNHNILLTERGTTFGYHNLVMDIRSIPIMQSIGCPVVVDVTHIVRIPGPTSQESSGGQPQFTEILARAAVAAGANALFLEVHPDPSHALCDAASQLSLGKLEKLLNVCMEISNIVS